VSLRLSFLPADAYELSVRARAAMARVPDGEFAAAGRPSIPSRASDLPRPRTAVDLEARELLAERLEAGLAAHEPPVAVLDAVRSLAHPETAVVLTGALPALCGGPLSVTLRALHAVRLARALTDEWGTPVVPVFWNRCDVPAEPPALTWLDERIELAPVQIAGFPSGGEPFDGQVFDSEQHTLGAFHYSLLHMAPRHASTEGLLEPFLPRHGETFASAFTRVLLELFGPMGLVTVEPAWIRAETSRAMADQVGEVRAPVDTPIAHRRGPEGGGRLSTGGEGFRFADEPGSRTPTEFAAELVQEPESWSPAWGFLPAVLDRLVPVAAELVEWSDLDARLADPLAGETALVPRVTHSLIDPALAGSLEALGTTPLEILRGPAAPESDPGPSEGSGEPADAESPEASDAPPGSPPVARAMREIASRLRAELLEQRGALAEVDRGLAAQLKRVAAEAKDLVDKLSTRTERVVTNRRAKRRRHERRVAHGLQPHGRPQEEVLSTLQFVLFNGRDWIEELAPEVDPFPTEHVLVHLPRRFERT